ncbi:hypothetical protein C8R48DRAFT_780104 [Suillus tomentosus]|nr:hypothetical protein C8R48DRAFT_780104 [Suillus tomentosus]
MFQTKVELVSAIQDIIRIQQIAVEECKILHRDCSLNNAMIEDDGKESYGTLIDWEFAVHILEGQKYAIGGTGTLPFMSRSLLFQLSEAVGGTAMSQNSWKHTSHSHAKVPPLIIHGYQDDLEGPLGVKRVFEKRSEGQWLLHLWSTDSFKEGSNEKTSFLSIRMQINSANNSTPTSITYSRSCWTEIIDLLTKHLNMLPKDEPSPKLLFARKVIDALPSGLPGGVPGEKRKVASEAADRNVDLPVMEHDMISGGRVLWTMEAIPQPKQMRTT